MEFTLYRDQPDRQICAIQLPLHVQRHALCDTKSGNSGIGFPLLSDLKFCNETPRAIDGAWGFSSKEPPVPVFMDKIVVIMTTSSGTSPRNIVRIGIDLGGTKIEFVALESDGQELHRHRVPTPRGDYDGTIRAIQEGVEKIESALQRAGTVGVGIPGTISQTTHTVKNANSTWMNGRVFDRDLGQALHREVRCANDAN